MKIRPGSEKLFLRQKLFRQGMFRLVSDKIGPGKKCQDEFQTRLLQTGPVSSLDFGSVVELMYHILHTDFQTFNMTIAIDQTCTNHSCTYTSESNEEFLISLLSDVWKGKTK